MKRVLILLLSAVLMTAALTGCSSGEEDALVSKTPFPEFSGTDSGESREQLDTAREILKEKGVTYHNISPDPEGDFYKDFVADISTYPTTYIVDSEGNIVGADIVGNVKKQLDTVETRLALITGQK